MAASFFEALGDAALATAMRALRRRDVARAQRLGARLGDVCWHADFRWRRLAEQQAAAALTLDADRARALVRANYRHYGAMLAELANADAIAARGDDWWSTQGSEHVAALARGGVIVTGHLGNWELVGHGHTRRFGPVAALVKPIANRRVDVRINAMRRRLGITPMVARGRALEVRRYLRNGGVLVVVADQESLYHEGVFVPFFGQLASTHYGPAMLALDAGVPVISAFGTRRGDGGLHIDYQPPLAIPPAGDLRARTWALTAALTARVEAAVRGCPEQWFWVHRRWGRRPRADVPAWKYGPLGRPAAELPAPPLPFVALQGQGAAATMDD